MKVLFLIFTILFSASVFSDCCNFEVKTSIDECQVVQETDHAHCADTTTHSTQEHCHCSPINHIKILPQESVAITSPESIPSNDFYSSSNLLISEFEATIFHPPIA